MRVTNIGLTIGTAIAALSVAVTAAPEAKAGSVYWNNNGGGSVMIHREHLRLSRLLPLLSQLLSRPGCCCWPGPEPAPVVTTVAEDASAIDAASGMIPATVMVTHSQVESHKKPFREKQGALVANHFDPSSNTTPRQPCGAFLAPQEREKHQEVLSYPNIDPHMTRPLLMNLGGISHLNT